MKLVSIASLLCVGVASAEKFVDNAYTKQAKEEAAAAGIFDFDGWYNGGWPAGPAPTPAPMNAIHYPPTKVQMAVMAKTAYGKKCGDTEPEMYNLHGSCYADDLNDSFGFGPRHGNVYAPSHDDPDERVDAKPYGNIKEFLLVDHDGIIDGAAQAHDCYNDWSETDPDDQSLHLGSAGRIYRSGALSGIGMHCDVEKFGHRLDASNKHVCTIAIRGTDDPANSVTCIPKFNSPDTNADCDGHKLAGNTSRAADNYDFYNYGNTFKCKASLLEYYVEQNIQWEVQSLKSGANCQETYTTGHSLGGVMASLSAMDDGASSMDYAYTFGALPFASVDEGNQDFGGFRLAHDFDFATNIDRKDFQHVHGATRISCVTRSGDDCESDPPGSTTKNEYTWEMNSASAHYMSKNCENCNAAIGVNTACALEYHGMTLTYIYEAVKRPQFWHPGPEVKLYTRECPTNRQLDRCRCPRCCTPASATGPNPDYADDLLDRMNANDDALNDPSNWFNDDIMGDIMGGGPMMLQTSELEKFGTMNGGGSSSGPDWDPECRFGHYEQVDCAGCNGCQNLGHTSNTFCQLHCAPMDQNEDGGREDGLIWWRYGGDHLVGAVNAINRVGDAMGIWDSAAYGAGEDANRDGVGAAYDANQDANQAIVGEVGF